MSSKHKVIEEGESSRQIKSVVIATRKELKLKIKIIVLCA